MELPLGFLVKLRLEFAMQPLAASVVCRYKMRQTLGHPAVFALICLRAGGKLLPTLLR